jgi:hypothetical protein
MDAIRELKIPKPYTLKIIYLSIVFMFSSCVYHETETPVICDCTATGNKDFNEVPSIAVSTTDGFYLLSPYMGYLNVCSQPDSEWQKDGTLLTASGTIKSTCIREDDHLKKNKQNFVDVNELVTSQDSLFNGLPIKIKIFASTFGDLHGYGYEVQRIPNGFHIVQPMIPSIEGFNPFKTKVQAYKVAVLVSYKMNLEFGLPTITRADLSLLQIEY